MSKFSLRKNIFKVATVALLALVVILILSMITASPPETAEQNTQELAVVSAFNAPGRVGSLTNFTCTFGSESYSSVETLASKFSTEYTPELKNPLVISFDLSDIEKPKAYFIDATETIDEMSIELLHINDDSMTLLAASNSSGVVDFLETYRLYQNLGIAVVSRTSLIMGASVTGSTRIGNCK